MRKNTIIILIILLIAILAVIYFLPRNKKQDEQARTSFEIQGMKIEILQQGAGEPSKLGDAVSVDYVGTLQDGTKFDSSIDRGQPFQFTLGQNRVIQGWELGVLGMKVGEKRKLTIPPELAYGTSGIAGIIPPNAILIFEVGMLAINK